MHEACAQLLQIIAFTMKYYVETFHCGKLSSYSVKNEGTGLNPQARWSHFDGAEM